jgi:quercetin dioxygenase-like cupin family protein
MSTSPTPGRVRTDPRERFAGSEKHFDLAREFEQLPRESVLRQGHMQKALYRHGPATTGIWIFEKDGGLTQHVIEGEAFIHVLEGRLFVRTAENEYTLGAGEILLLDAGTPHDMRAVVKTRMMMTFVMRGER